MGPEMTSLEHENQEKLSREIRAAFGSISCNEYLKKQTKSYVIDQMNSRNGARTMAWPMTWMRRPMTRMMTWPAKIKWAINPLKMRWAVSLACLVLLLSSGLGGYQLYYAEAATISIDVNPSIELEVNRWGKVVDEATYGKDSEEILSTVSLKHLEYEDALERLLESEAMKKYLNTDSVVTITVESRSNDSQLMTNLQACVDSALVRRHDGITAEYASVDENMCQEAHSHGMSVGKYNAIKALIEEDPAATLDEFKYQSMKEIKTHMEHCGHEAQDVPGQNNSEPNNPMLNDPKLNDPVTPDDESLSSEGSGCGQHHGCSGGHHSQ